jgi:hypothetical protein
LEKVIDQDIVAFQWMKTCQGIRERVFAAAEAARLVEDGRLQRGDLVTVGYNACADQVIMAAPGRSRRVEKVAVEATAAEALVEKRGWKIWWVEVPDDAPGWAQKSPMEWDVSQGIRQ